MIFLRFFIYLFILKLTPAEDVVEENYNSHRRIIGGKYTSNITKYPFMAEVVQKFIDPVTQEPSASVCGGSIVHASFILTAAHCLRQCNCAEGVDDSDCPTCVSLDTETFTIYTGGLSPSSQDVVVSYIQSFFYPANFKHTDMTNMCTLRYDIGLIRLKTPLNLNPSMAIVNLPDPVNIDVDDMSKTVTTIMTVDNKKCKILGWGKTAIVDVKPILERYLKVATTPLLDKDKCVYHLTKVLPTSIFPNRGLCDTHICSLDIKNKVGFCDGDSGGPLVLDNTQYGVISQCLLPDCVGKHLAQLYTRVDINVNWINDILKTVEQI